MGASEGTSPLGGGVSLPEIRASVTATLHARTGRRCASARVRCGDPPDPAIALEAAHRRLRASHESLLASRARVDAKYVTEVERRSEMATDAAESAGTVVGGEVGPASTVMLAIALDTAVAASVWAFCC